MSYESPINIITSQITSELVAGVDGEIFKEVQKVGVMVDRDELLRALAYDRGQYQKGYDDRDAEIVHCKDCVYWDKGSTEECNNSDSVCFHNGWCKPDWFCKDGERREQE